MSGFRKGSRERVRARIAIDGPSGSGKSLTALRFAQAMGSKIGVIDSERRSALLYVGMEFDEKKFEFDHRELTSYSPAEYTAAIAESAAAGHDVLIIDSLSHAWEGLDGALEMVSRKGGNSYVAWADVTPVHRRMVEAILSFPGHVICTMRSKTEYVLEKNEKGKEVPRKIGMAPIQRPGMEYEFTLYCSLDDDHFIRVSKCRGSSLDGATGHKPGAAWIAPFVAWLNTGETAAPVGPVVKFATDDQVKELLQLVVDLGIVHRIFKAEMFKRYAVEEAHLLLPEQIAEMLRLYRIKKADREKLSPAKDAAPATEAAAPVATNAAGGEASSLQEALEGEAEKAAVVGEPAAGNGLATQEQLRRLVETRESLYSVRGLPDEPAHQTPRAELWAKCLSLYSVDTARKLTVAQADELEKIIDGKVQAAAAEYQDKRAAERAKEKQPPDIKPAAPPR